MDFVPLTAPLTVYRAMASKQSSDQFTNDDYTSTTTDKTLLDGLGKVVSIALPVGTPVAKLPEDGEVVLDKGTTFQPDGDTLKIVSPEDQQQQQQQQQEQQQAADDHEAIGNLPDVNFDPPPPLPTNIGDFLNQIEYVGDPPDDWQTTPETEDDGEQPDTMFGMDMNDDGDGPDSEDAADEASESSPPVPTVTIMPAAPIDLSPVVAAVQTLADAINSSRIDLGPIAQAIAAQQPPQVSVTTPTLDLSPLLAAVQDDKDTPLDLSPLLAALANNKTEIDYVALAKALSSMPAPQITVTAPQVTLPEIKLPDPVDITSLAQALERGLLAQASALRALPAPQITVAPASRPALRDVKFHLDADGNPTGATLN